LVKYVCWSFISQDETCSIGLRACGWLFLNQGGVSLSPTCCVLLVCFILFK
jgi:hypothetical protein